jgi:hypothetical protein
MRNIQMDALIETIDAAVDASDYMSLVQVFSLGPSSWQTVGQGEQRSLAAYLIKATVSSPSFNIEQALASNQMMKILLETLNHLPTTPLEGAADNKLRQMIFDYKVNNEADYAAAARVLAGMRMEDDQESVYYFTPAEKCDGETRTFRLSIDFCRLGCAALTTQPFSGSLNVPL